MSLASVSVLRRAASQVTLKREATAPTALGTSEAVDEAQV